jgi:enoyl-CoA hydratase/carnithine racemase
MLVDYTKEGRIAIFTINRPEVRNALNSQVCRELSRALNNFRDDPELWVGIITGAGDRAFCAGADINELLAGLGKEPSEDLAWVNADQMYKPLIAAIHGYCLGGGLEVALVCDIRIAADNARLGIPEVTIGFMPGAGGTQRLTRFVPRAKAAEMLFMGQQIDAQEAYRIGLVNKVVPREQLMPTARQWAEAICQVGPLAVRSAKEAMLRGYSMTIEEGLRLERDLANRLRITDDFIEGTAAFLEKRKPTWKAQ